MDSFRRLKGTEDIFADEAKRFGEIEARVRAVFRRYGFFEIRTPFLEEKRLFTHALGTGTDVVQKEMYEFLDKSDEYVALRPEGTAGVVRAFIENNFHKTQGSAKLFYLGPMFRRERPQKGRLRQFHQIGAEVIGVDHPYADAEVIAALCQILTELGAGGYKVKLNNLGTFQEREGYRKELQQYFEPHIAKLCEDCKNRYYANKLFRILDCKNEHCRNIVMGVPQMSKHLSDESQQHYARVKDALAVMGIAYIEDRYMVRGLDYYTKTVFEIAHPKLGAQDALAAGGRYDKLVESLGGPSLGAVGFAIGLERLLLCLDAPKADPAVREDHVTLVSLSDEAFKKSFETLGLLRREGIAAEMDLQGKSFKSQMRTADKMKSAYVLILGEDELKKNVFSLKNMRTGEQEEIAAGSVVQEIKKRMTSC